MAPVTAGTPILATALRPPLLLCAEPPLVDWLVCAEVLWLAPLLLWPFALLRRLALCRFDERELERFEALALARLDDPALRPDDAALRPPDERPPDEVARVLRLPDALALRLPLLRLPLLRLPLLRLPLLRSPLALLRLALLPLLRLPLPRLALLPLLPLLRLPLLRLALLPLDPLAL